MQFFHCSVKKNVNDFHRKKFEMQRDSFLKNGIYRNFIVTSHRMLEFVNVFYNR